MVCASKDQQIMTNESSIAELTDSNFHIAAVGGGRSNTSKSAGLFEIEDFSFDIEQTLNIGSQRFGR